MPFVHAHCSFNTFMPLGISSYSTYNTLVVFAPEIRGLWDFTLIPGTLKEDGTIDWNKRSIKLVRSGAVVLLYTLGIPTLILFCWIIGKILIKSSQVCTGSDNEEKAWEFLKWWASAETQLRFGRELESVMGSSARYATANVDAMQTKRMPDNQEVP